MTARACTASSARASGALVANVKYDNSGRLRSPPAQHRPDCGSFVLSFFGFVASCLAFLWQCWQTRTPSPAPSPKGPSGCTSSSSRFVLPFLSDESFTHKTMTNNVAAAPAAVVVVVVVLPRPNGCPCSHSFECASNWCNGTCSTPNASTFVLLRR